MQLWTNFSKYTLNLWKSIEIQWNPTKSIKILEYPFKTRYYIYIYACCRKSHMYLYIYINMYIYTPFITSLSIHILPRLHVTCDALASTLKTKDPLSSAAKVCEGFELRKNLVVYHVFYSFSIYDICMLYNYIYICIMIVLDIDIYIYNCTRSIYIYIYHNMSK